MQAVPIFNQTAQHNFKTFVDVPSIKYLFVKGKFHISISKRQNKTINQYISHLFVICYNQGFIAEGILWSLCCIREYHLYLEVVEASNNCKKHTVLYLSVTVIGHCEPFSISHLPFHVTRRLAVGIQKQCWLYKKLSALVESFCLQIITMLLDYLDSTQMDFFLQIFFGYLVNVLYKNH